MKYELLNQYEVVEAMDGSEFKAELNRIMRELSGQKPTCKIEIAGATWRALVSYTEEVKIPENLEDEYRLRGQALTCGDCPHFQIEPGNKNRRWAECDADGTWKKRKADSWACEWLYEKIERKEVEICKKKNGEGKSKRRLLIDTTR